MRGSAAARQRRTLSKMAGICYSPGHLSIRLQTLP